MLPLDSGGMLAAYGENFVLSLTDYQIIGRMSAYGMVAVLRSLRIQSAFAPSSWDYYQGKERCHISNYIRYDDFVKMGVQV